MFTLLDVAFHEDAESDPYVVLHLSKIDSESDDPASILLQLCALTEDAQLHEGAIYALAAQLTVEFSFLAQAVALGSNRLPSFPELRVRITAGLPFTLACDTLHYNDMGRGPEIGAQMAADAEDSPAPIDALHGFSGSAASFREELRKLPAIAAFMRQQGGES